MEHSALLLLTLLTFLFAGPCFGQRGDMDIIEWMKEKDKLIKNVEDKLKNVEQCMNEVEVLDARLNATADELMREKAETEKLKKENEGLKNRLDATEKEIDELKQNNEQTATRIAFSASLTNSGEIYKGPCKDKTLTFQRIFSNIGNGYNAATGIFTAPVSGLYYFTFSTYGYNTHVTGAILMKNNVRQISTYESPTVDGSDISSNSAVLQLAAGDKVHLELWDNGRVFDNMNGHTTFSGFLLFTL